MSRVDILEFKVSNFRSINEEVTIDFSDKNGRMRAITAFFGANASGKSNIAKAYDTFIEMIINSCNASHKLPYQPFKFQIKSTVSPTLFSLKFSSNNDTYEYGFAYNQQKIINEYLKIKNRSTNHYSYIFYREDGKLNASSKNYGFNNGMFGKTRPDSLLITKAFEDNNKYSVYVHEAASNICVFTCDINRSEHIAINLLKDNPELLEQLNKILKKADFTLRKIEVNNIKIPEEVLLTFMAPESVKESMRQNGALSLDTKHYLRNGNEVLEEGGKKLFTTMNISDESMGTRDFIGLMAPILYGAKIGGTAFIDEFGAYLHPALAKAIINTCKQLNKEKGLRLIINTHDASLMNYLEVDDCILVEKDRIQESTKVIPLRNRLNKITPSIEKQYINNVYGGVGIIDEVLV